MKVAIYDVTARPPEPIGPCVDYTPSMDKHIQETLERERNDGVLCWVVYINRATSPQSA